MSLIDIVIIWPGGQAGLLAGSASGTHLDRRVGARGTVPPIGSARCSLTSVTQS